jgi:hypothetical protein
VSDHDPITVVFAEEVVMADPQVVDTSESQEEEVQQEIDLLPS